MNAYEQIELDLVTEIEELETEIKKRTEFVKENATREFPLTNYSRITYAMERKLDNLQQSLKHLQCSLEYLQADVKGGTKEQQVEEQVQAEKEEAAAKAKQGKEEIDLTECYELELNTFCGTEYYDLDGVQVKEIVEGINKGETYFELTMLESGRGTTIISFDTRCYTFRIFNGNDKMIVSGNKQQVEINL